VLTRPGLSVIVSAIIGARKIFQRMTTYSKYTVAMTFRICFTFGLLTVIYDWCARSPPLLSGSQNTAAVRSQKFAAETQIATLVQVFLGTHTSKPQN
jgi:heme A synthase